SIQVLLLGAEANLPAAVKAAQERILKNQKDTYPTTTLEPAKEPRTNKVLQDGPGDVGAFRGHLTKLVIKNDANRERYGLLAVARIDEGTLVVFGECRWERREVWDDEFRQVLEGVRRARAPAPPKKKAGGKNPKTEE